MVLSKGTPKLDMLPSHVHDIASANCLFCPYGAEVETGDRLYVYDEKTVFGRQQRERLVEITAIKQFRSTGRVVTLDLNMISPEEMAHIAGDSEVEVEALLAHHPGNPTFDPKHPPVVVYFQPCDEDDTTGSHTQPSSAISLDGKPQNRHASPMERALGKFFPRKKPTPH